MATKTKRMPSAQRKEQIVNATLSLIAEDGLSNATINKIAHNVGISEPAIYRHFKNRKEILLATLDNISIQLISLYNPEGDAAERLRVTGKSFYNFVMNHPDSSKVLFEFVCASPSEGLRKNVQEKMLLIISLARGLLDEGVKTGVLKKDFDLDMKAWEIFSLGFTLNFASLLGFDNIITQKKAMNVIEDMLKNLLKA